MIRRGDVHWADLGPARGSEPAKHRPVVVISSDRFNASRIATVVVAAITSNTQVAEHPGNVFVSASASGLPKDSAVNLTSIVTLSKEHLGSQVGSLPTYLVDEIDEGLRLTLGV
ncbi:type II toxin-antitoxin system PemK/MazF family toxin [Antribacter gilvus]|uniref:type II toxin-antitoxin system PemK/MazF family toxin n=1 Tax=Antribacter gilvus TaxID=2304675 RepID=UPI001F0BD2F5|nr:type II toxin-antitoxin system PemK/MazF family toxin [Antribacter gilvus]